MKRPPATGPFPGVLALLNQGYALALGTLTILLIFRPVALDPLAPIPIDRKSTRLNSSHT